MAILNAMWESSSYLEGEIKSGIARSDLQTFDQVNFAVLLKNHYNLLPQLPCGKYAVTNTTFIEYVALVSWFSLRRLSYDSTFFGFEIVLWAFGVSASFTSLLRLLSFGVKFYILSLRFVGFFFLCFL